MGNLLDISKKSFSQNQLDFFVRRNLKIKQEKLSL